MGRRRLVSSKEAAILLGIATEEDRLIRHFTLDPADRLECELRRRPQDKLGFAFQLCTMRQTGRLLWDNEQPPAAVITYLADQLGSTRASTPSMRIEYRRVSITADR